LYAVDKIELNNLFNKVGVNYCAPKVGYLSE